MATSPEWEAIWLRRIETQVNTEEIKDRQTLLTKLQEHKENQEDARRIHAMDNVIKFGEKQILKSESVQDTIFENYSADIENAASSEVLVAIDNSAQVAEGVKKSTKTRIQNISKEKARQMLSALKAEQREVRLAENEARPEEERLSNAEINRQVTEDFGGLKGGKAFSLDAFKARFGG